MNEIVQAPTPIEGEILTDKAPNTEVEKLCAVIAECEESLDAILDVAQRIDHGMTDARPNAPNREIVRIARETLGLLRRAAQRLALEDESGDDVALLENSNTDGAV